MQWLPSRTISPRKQPLCLRLNSWSWRRLLLNCTLLSKLIIYFSSKLILCIHLTCEFIWEPDGVFLLIILNRICHDLMSVSFPLPWVNLPLENSGVLCVSEWEMFMNLLCINELLATLRKHGKELKQSTTFFMFLALCGLPIEYSTKLDKILCFESIFTFSSVTRWSPLHQFLAK